MTRIYLECADSGSAGTTSNINDVFVSVLEKVHLKLKSVSFKQINSNSFQELSAKTPRENKTSTDVNNRSILVSLPYITEFLYEKNNIYNITVNRRRWK